MASRAGFRMRRSARARTLAAVALTGVAALLAACSSTAPGQSTAPSAPSTSDSGAGAAPVAIEPELLASDGLFERVSADGVAVLWSEPGESLAVVIGGSGGGGGCIPQPNAAELDDGAVTIAFDPPDPAMMCTADFALHGWTLGLPEPVDAAAPLDVQLTDLQGEGETREVRVESDDVLTAPADPQPSLIDDAPGATAPTPIPEDQLPDADAVIPPGTLPQVAVKWLEPGASLAVMTIGSVVAPACNATPVGATVTGPGAIEVAFELPQGDMDCPADGGLYGWEFPLPERIPAALGVEVTVTGTMHDGSEAVIALAPEDVLGQP
ncbi:hypothetical protein [Agrococcus sp. TF02-05]|uniref:hypothetical protein n=1 Tax=Agrococcus sp. TF02-05 TaxID=2815211 RepID=UPI001AA0DB34|nr:hypothetical protein [Agrococcus sp. TF02-05]MBO1769445.1 hypothetical protein [Agrococcus sp. TF02-05]